MCLSYAGYTFYGSTYSVFQSVLFGEAPDLILNSTTSLITAGWFWALEDSCSNLQMLIMLYVQKCINYSNPRVFLAKEMKHGELSEMHQIT